MKEKELIALGFNRKDVTAEESSWFITYDADWYYYEMDFGDGHLGLMSSSNEEVENDEWYVELFDDNTIRFTDSSDVMAFIDLINRNTVK